MVKYSSFFCKKHQEQWPHYCLCIKDKDVSVFPKVPAAKGKDKVPRDGIERGSGGKVRK